MPEPFHHWPTILNIVPVVCVEEKVGITAWLNHCSRSYVLMTTTGKVFVVGKLKRRRRPTISRGKGFGNSLGDKLLLEISCARRWKGMIATTPRISAWGSTGRRRGCCFDKQCATIFVGPASGLDFDLVHAPKLLLVVRHPAGWLGWEWQVLWLWRKTTKLSPWAEYSFIRAQKFCQIHCLITHMGSVGRTHIHRTIDEELPNVHFTSN